MESCCATDVFRFLLLDKDERFSSHARIGWYVTLGRGVTTMVALRTVSLSDHQSHGFPRRSELTREQLMHQSDMVINLPLFALSQPRIVLCRDIGSVILQCLVVAEFARKLTSARDEFPCGLEKFFADGANVEFDVVGNEVLNPNVSAALLERAVYRHRGGRTATRFKCRPKNCVIAESDSYLLIVQMSVGEELDAVVVGIARLALEVIANIHNFSTRKHCSMRRAHPLVQVDMESNVRPICQPLYLSVRQPRIHVHHCNIAATILREEISDLLRSRRLRA